MKVGNLSGVLWNPDQTIRDGAMWFLFMGFSCLLMDALLEIYKPRKQQVILILRLLLTVIFLYVVITMIYTLLYTLI